MTIEEADKFIAQTSKMLGEHFDAVLILASWPADDGSGDTEYTYHGAGNSFAQEGMARDFLSETQNEDLADELQAILGESEDDDGWKGKDKQ